MGKYEYAISTWSLHGLITSGTDLLEIPEQVAAHGIDYLELCHFHLASQEQSYLSDFASAIGKSGVKLSTILIDSGDIASPDDTDRRRDILYNKSWIDNAATLGAKRVRVCAGRQPPTHDALMRSADSLAELSDYSTGLQIEVITENWLETSLEPQDLLKILSLSGRQIGLCADTGNSEGPRKYQTLELLAPHALAIHYKARYDDQGRVDMIDLGRCLTIFARNDYKGAITLIYGDTFEEWKSIDAMKAVVEQRD